MRLGVGNGWGGAAAWWGGGCYPGRLGAAVGGTLAPVDEHIHPTRDQGLDSGLPPPPQRKVSHQVGMNPRGEDNLVALLFGHFRFNFFGYDNRKRS